MGCTTGSDTFKVGKLYCSIRAEQWKGENNKEKERMAKTFWLSYMHAFWFLPKPMMNKKEAKHFAKLQKAAILLAADPLTRDLGRKAFFRFLLHKQRYIAPKMASQFGMRHQSRSPDTDLNFFVGVSEILLQQFTTLDVSDRLEFIRSQLYGLFGKMPTPDALRMRLERLSSDIKLHEWIADDCVETTRAYFRGVLPQKGDVMKHLPSVSFLKDLSEASHNFDNLLWRMFESAAEPPNPTETALKQYLMERVKYMLGNKQFADLIKSIHSEQK